jgi:hypothetical protein
MLRALPATRDECIRTRFAALRDEPRQPASVFRDPTVGRHRGELEKAGDTRERLPAGELLEKRREGRAPAVANAVAHEMPGLEASFPEIPELSIALSACDLERPQSIPSVPPQDPSEGPAAEGAIGVEVEVGSAQGPSVAAPAGRAGPKIGHVREVALASGKHK